MLTSRALVAGCLVLPFALGCGNKQPMDDTDMASADMAKEDKDLKPADDLTKPADDLANPADKPMLTGLPMCQAIVIDGATFYEKTFAKNCTNANCHNFAKDIAAVKTWWVGQAAKGTVVLPLVKPGEIHQSYVMYKIMGQHLNPLVKGAGDQMPKRGAMLMTDDICNFINWIKGGAG